LKIFSNNKTKTSIPTIHCQFLLKEKIMLF